LATIPILAIIWFALLALIVFIPLPNNTIVNHNPAGILVNTHAHTIYSHDGLISQGGLWRWHKRNGFDAFFITDHNNHDKTLEFVQKQREGVLPPDPLVMCGEEFSGSNHLSLLGLQRKFSTRGYADSTAVDSVRSNGGAVIVNHWFDDEKMSLAYYRELGVDGFEIENTASDKLYDRDLYTQIKDFCTVNGLVMNGGVDFHGYGNVCSLWNAFDIPDWDQMDQHGKEAAILEVLKLRDQSRLQVLKYRDRPYYGNDHLWISPIRTLFYYFRTLRWTQMLSWAIWLFVITYVSQTIAINASSEWRSVNRLLPLSGIVGAVFLIVLGLVYLSRHRAGEGFTEMFVEYGQLLLITGTAFLLYSGLVAYFRIFKGQSSKGSPS
jgi:predicted metal-dependent phosphoesterase TrpH